MEVVDKSFEFREVAEYPPEMDRWRATSESVLALTRPARDLSPEDEADILMIDNGDWGSDAFVHLHKAGSCDCGGPAECKKRMKSCTMRSVGAGCVLALLYRWKGVEQASAWWHRSRRQHRLLDRSLPMIWTSKDPVLLYVRATAVALEL